jgi:hypothetical protein
MIKLNNSNKNTQLKALVEQVENTLSGEVQKIDQSDKN